MKNDTDQQMPLTTREPGTLATPSSPAEMMQAVIDKGITAESVGVMERLIAMKERLDAKEAEKEFNAAYVKLQSELPDFTPDRNVKNRDGVELYQYASFESIMEKLREPLKRNGFAVSFSMSFDGTGNVPRVIQTCTVRHVGGHSQSNSFAARVGKGPPNSSEAQGDGAASTYAKRFALCNAFNIVIERDTDAALGTDARAEGEIISPEQVATLREQIAEAQWHEAGFLKLAGVERLEDVRSGSYPVLMRAIQAKKAQAKKGIA